MRMYNSLILVSYMYDNLVLPSMLLFKQENLTDTMYVVHTVLCLIQTRLIKFVN